MDFRADLHIHSYFSDGTHSPEEILYLAKEKKLKGLSITDHDTTEAYSDELFAIADDLNLFLISGVEISSQLFDSNVHILAYNFDLSSKPFQDFLQKVIEKRKDRNIQILKKLSEKNMDISEQELIEFTTSKNVSKTTVGRVHIAQLMCEKGYVKNLNEAFSLYIKDKGVCYVSGEKFSPKEVIDQIHKANGKAVLAHPSVIQSRKVINNLLEHEFDGIEVYYAKLFATEEKRWQKIADKHSLIATGGSDFHGENKPYLSLGCSWVNEETFNKLIS